MEALEDIKYAVWLASEWARLRSEFEAYPDKEFLKCILRKGPHDPDPIPALWSFEFRGVPTNTVNQQEQWQWAGKRTDEFERLVIRGGLLLEATWPGYGNNFGAIRPHDLWAESLYIPRWRDWKEPSAPFSLYPERAYVECCVDNIAEKSIRMCRDYEGYALSESYGRVHGIPPIETGTSKTPVEWLTQTMMKLGVSSNRLSAFGGPDKNTTNDILDGERPGRIETWHSICAALSKIGKKEVTPADVPNLETFLNSPKNSR